MRFSTIFTVLAAGAMAFAGAVPEIVAKRSNADIQNAFTDLSHKCDTIIPKFDNCWDDECSDAIVVELVAAVDVCTAALGGLHGGLATPALATVVAEVVTVSVGRFPGFHLTDACLQKISVGLDGHKTKCGSKCPGLIDIYAKVDLSLSLCLKAVFELVFGLLVLVTAL
jgi:hypothetical protein